MTGDVICANSFRVLKTPATGKKPIKTYENFAESYSVAVEVRQS